MLFDQKFLYLVKLILVKKLGKSLSSTYFENYGLANLLFDSTVAVLKRGNLKTDETKLFSSSSYLAQEITYGKRIDGISPVLITGYELKKVNFDTSLLKKFEFSSSIFKDDSLSLFSSKETSLNDKELSLSPSVRENGTGQNLYSSFDSEGLSTREFIDLSYDIMKTVGKIRTYHEEQVMIDSLSSVLMIIGSEHKDSIKCISVEMNVVLKNLKKFDLHDINFYISCLIVFGPSFTIGFLNYLKALVVKNSTKMIKSFSDITSYSSLIAISNYKGSKLLMKRRVEFYDGSIWIDDNDSPKFFYETSNEKSIDLVELFFNGD